MKLRKIFMVVAALASFDASAGLVLDRTRIIYPEGVSHLNLLITNPDSYASIAQVWMDKDDIDSAPENVDHERVPFFLTPPVARVNAGMGQTVRVSYTGGELPKDRESIFYLNVLQIPPKSALDAASNKLVVLMRTRIKVFYRPKSLQGKEIYFSDGLDFGFKGEEILVKNKTPYFASFRSANLKVGGNSYELEAEMVPPFSERSWKVSSSWKGDSAELEVYLINDYGASHLISKEISR